MFIAKKKITYSKKDVEIFLDKKINFSQSAIANEWEIDNDTLSKWFLAYYGENIFFNRKKLRLSEYILVFKDLFVLEKDKLSNDTEYIIPENHLDFYSSAVMKGKTYLKKDIIEEAFNINDDLQPRHYEQALFILSPKFSYYSTLNKFPNSLAHNLIEELRKHA